MLTPADIRSRIAAAVGALNGWTESRVGYDLFGADPRQLAHHAFAVGLPSTAVASGDRQRRGRGVLSSTTVTIRWAHRIRPEVQVADYGAALAAELELVEAVFGVDPSPALAPRLEGVPLRTTSADGLYFLGTVTFTVPHTYPLGG